MGKKRHSYIIKEQKEITMKVILMSITIDITILINEKGTLLCKIGTIFLINMYTDDSISIVILAKISKKNNWLR